MNIFASGDEAIELRLKEFKTLESVALNASSDTTAVYVHSGLFNINSTSASFTTTTGNAVVMELLDFVVGDGTVAPSVNVTANGNSGISEGNRGVANWTVNSGKLTVAQNVPGYVGFNFDTVGVDHKLVINGSGEIEVVNYGASVAAWNGANVYIQNNGTFNSIGGWIMVKSIENYGSFTTDMSNTTGDTAAVRADIVVNGTSEKVANMTILANLNQDALTHYSSGLSMNINSGVLDITRKNTIWEGADGTAHNKNGISSDRNATINVAEGATIKLWGWGTGINAPNWMDPANNTISVNNSGIVDMYFTVTKTFGHVYFEGNSHIN